MGPYPWQAMSVVASATAARRRGGPTCRLHVWSSLLCAGMLSTACLAAASQVADVGAETGGLSEITITAEKYSPTIQETPISISALSGDDLAAAGITTVEDVAKDVPGLSMRSAGPGQTEYEARGLASNGGAGPTVGFFLVEGPFLATGVGAVGEVVI